MNPPTQDGKTASTEARWNIITARRNIIALSHRPAAGARRPLVKIGFAQLNTTVGDLRGNQRLILSAYRELVARGAELVLTPELALTGYPPQDLLFKSRFVPMNLEILAEMHREIGETPLLVLGEGDDTECEDGRDSADDHSPEYPGLI